MKKGIASNFLNQNFSLFRAVQMIGVIGPTMLGIVQDGRLITLKLMEGK